MGNENARLRDAMDMAAIKLKQQQVWASGDFAVIGSTLQWVGEELAESCDLRAGQKVIDVAAGNGNASLAAARRFADVTAVDFVPALLEKAKVRAEADQLRLSTTVADAEQLPFEDGCFDVALSSFGVMFTPNHEASTDELCRVVRRHGTIALANWTPNGFIGKLFAILGKYLPPAQGLKSPILWGDKAYVTQLFGVRMASVRFSTKQFYFRYRSAEHWLQVFRNDYGPMKKAFEHVDDEQRPLLEADILDLLRKMNIGGASSLIVPSEYLEAVIVRR